MSNNSLILSKMSTIKHRKNEARILSAHADGIARHVELASVDVSTRGGCGTRFCNWLSQKVGRASAREARRRAAQILAEVDAGCSSSTATAASLSNTVGTSSSSSSSSCSSSATAVHRAVFGLAGSSKENPAKKLEDAAQVMRARIEQLELRAQEARAEATSLAKIPAKKSQALRALKKAKQIEAQVSSNQSSLDAVEQQVDLLASAAIQKKLTSALASTSQSMKGDAKLLTKAEKAVDDAQDARDVANDLNDVVADFAARGQGDLDDDELVAELEMMASEPPLDAPRDSIADEDDAKEAEEAMRKLVAYHADIDGDRSLRGIMPSVPQTKLTKKEERQKLLSVQ